MTRQIDPAKIRPLHGVRDRAKLDALTADMRAHGWHGFPLLVIEIADGYRAADDGSHRIAAARAAGLLTVPCYVVKVGDKENEFDVIKRARQAMQREGLSDEDLDGPGEV